MDNIINENMNKIKFLKPDIKTGKQQLLLSNKYGHMVSYKGYSICELPPKFGTDEITTWFNYKGLTYIAE
tara:strand:- start:366 stop:575 length:210 start_codon:yes stop_codon:yes gene_type:complete